MGTGLDTLVRPVLNVFIYHEARVTSSSQLYAVLEWNGNGTCWCIALLAGGLLDGQACSPLPPGYLRAVSSLPVPSSRHTCALGLLANQEPGKPWWLLPRQLVAVGPLV